MKEDGSLQSRDLFEMLGRHYSRPTKPSPGYYLGEVQAPGSNRRADALWVPLTSFGRGSIIGHEIKVSRSDVIAELNDPTKADAWGKFCTEWWLVISDPKLIEGLQVPPKWGIMSPPSGRNRISMTIIRQAPQLTPEDGQMAFATLLTRFYFSNQEVLREAESKVRRAQEGLTFKQREVDRLSAAAGNQFVREDPVVMKAIEVQRAIGTKLAAAGEYIYGQQEPSVDEIADALIDLALTRKAAKRVRGEIAGQVDDFRTIVKGLRITPEVMKRLEITAEGDTGW